MRHVLKELPEGRRSLVGVPAMVDKTGVHQALLRGCHHVGHVQNQSRDPLQHVVSEEVEAVPAKTRAHRLEGLRQFARINVRIFLDHQPERLQGPAVGDDRDHIHHSAVDLTWHALQHRDR